MMKKKVIRKKTKKLVVLTILTAVIIPLFFYYGFHESLFTEGPDISVSISTVSIIPELNGDINFTNKEDKGKILKYLTENNIIPISAWKTYTYYLGYNPEKNMNFCALHFFMDDDIKEEMRGKKFHFYYDVLFKNENCVNCLDGYLVVSNDANKKTDNVKFNLCINEDYYFKKEDISNLDFLSSHCVNFQQSDLDYEEQIPSTFKIYSGKQPPSFDILRIYNPENPSGELKIGVSKLSDIRTKNDLFTITEGKYFLWNRQFPIKNDNVFKFFTIIIPNCSN